MEMTRKQMAILISEKIDFKTKAIKKDKEGHYIMIKESIQEEDITIANIGAPKCIKQILTDIKGEMDGNKKILEDINTSLISMDRSFRQKISKVIGILNDIIDS